MSSTDSKPNLRNKSTQKVRILRERTELRFTQPPHKCRLNNNLQNEDISDCEGEHSEDNEDDFREIEAHKRSEEDELVEVDDGPEHSRRSLTEVRIKTYNALYTIITAIISAL